MARAEANQLVREGRNERHQHDPAQEQRPERHVGARDQAEEEDADENNEDDDSVKGEMGAGGSGGDPLSLMVEDSKTVSIFITWRMLAGMDRFLGGELAKSGLSSLLVPVSS